MRQLSFVLVASCYSHALTVVCDPRAVSECKSELFADKEAVDDQLLLYPNVTLEFCSYGYYTLQNYACETHHSYPTAVTQFHHLRDSTTALQILPYKAF